VEMPKYLVAVNTGGNVPSVTVYHKWGTTTLEIYDLFGRLILKQIIPRSQNQVQADVSQWYKGMYLFRLVYNNSTVANEKVIVN
jgi:hypothetical protein